MIYLDNAATTFPKPASVIREMQSCMTLYCGNPGRGSHRMAVAASEKLYECRCAAMDLFDADEAECVSFTFNATMALNMAIKGLIPDMSHIIISDLEHNSVRRPVAALCQNHGCTLDIFATDGTDDEIISRVLALIKPSTKALVCLHASNIVNRVLPIRALGELCEQKGIYFILDASQSAGVLDISMKKDKITALCMPGHKGLLGPQGTGLLILSENVYISTILEGGSGVNSADTKMPDFLPDRLEAGTMPTPGAAGLLEGIRYVKARGLEAIGKDERLLCEKALRELSRVGNIEIYEKNKPGSIILFNINGMSAATCASELDKGGICVRAGLHCSPLGHMALGTPAGGAVRASIGPFSRAKDIIGFCSAVRDIAEQK